jgi:hypothetical protein
LDADGGCESGIHNNSFENGTIERVSTSTGGGSPGNSVRGQYGYRDAVLNNRNVREDSRGWNMKVISQRSERMRQVIMNEKDLDENMFPPQVIELEIKVTSLIVF